MRFLRLLRFRRTAFLLRLNLFYPLKNPRNLLPDILTLIYNKHSSPNDTQNKQQYRKINSQYLVSYCLLLFIRPIPLFPGIGAFILFLLHIYS